MKKNILIFGHGYATQFIDITNQYTQLFNPEKFNITVAYLTGEENTAVRQRHLSNELIFMNMPPASTRGLKIRAIKQMWELHREKKFDIVICHRYKPAYVMLWVNQFCEIPHLFMVMHEFNTLKSFSRKCCVAALFRKNMFFAGVSNAVNENIRQSISGSGIPWGIPKKQVITLYNMIDVEKTQAAFFSRETARAKFNLPHNSVVFGTIARLAPAKDQQTLITAFSLIKPICPHAKLLLIGDGILENTLKAQVTALDINNDVIFAGYLDQAFRWLPAFDVFTLTSIKEAFGRALLEAMLAKLPIIATKINGIPEVIDETGILIPPRSPELLAEKMKLFYNMPPIERDAWGLRSEERVKTHFSLQQFNRIFWGYLDETRFCYDV